MARGTPPEQGATAEAAADEAFAHAIAKQYVLDAEAAGSYVPSHRSRVNTGASALAVGSDRLTTSASEETAPQLPGLHFMGQDYESSVSVEKLSTASLSQLQQQQQQQQRRAYEYSLSEKDSEPRGESEERAMSQRLRDEEVEDDANEASHFVSARMRYPAPQYTVRADGSLPLGAVLFAGGFLLLPLWWLGVLLPRKCDTDVARTWRKYNALMSLLSLPLLALFLALGGWQATHG
ncbi:hypothetical protein H4R21_004522 [Coemansia helicoidea]|uniref:Uncharacterized protein n=3 Tax=Coemansia TaxID=4863 RepID=A0ACC1KXI2_9FUNG|nr:hypothetical protein H4R21_004522 [Coemansia helicoidea]